MVFNDLRMYKRQSRRHGQWGAAPFTLAPSLAFVQHGKTANWDPAKIPLLTHQGYPFFYLVYTFIGASLPVRAGTVSPVGRCRHGWSLEVPKMRRDHAVISRGLSPMLSPCIFLPEPVAVVECLADCTERAGHVHTRRQGAEVAAPACACRASMHVPSVWVACTVRLGS